MIKAKGFTLVEVIVSVSVVAIVMYALIAVFVTSGFRGVNVEVFTVAQSLAEGKLEEISARNFAGITGESETNYTGDLSDFSYEVVIDYVASDDLDTPVGFETNYKRVRVQIRHPKLTNPAQFESIRAWY
jgi:prepilin-type N-terminal cleavage/methylation domain-containing protein